MRLALRRELPPADPLLQSGQACIIGEIAPDTDWSQALHGVTAVVHLANLAHEMDGQKPLARYLEVNVEGSANLARQAAATGVKRLVYLSSIKVLGERSFGKPLDETSPANPSDVYAQSKWQAEQVLREVAGKTGLEVVILRPPLVYGPGVRANFLRLMKWVARGLPLPLGAATNRRSLVFVGNLVSAIEACLNHPAAAGRTYLVSDGEAISSAELVRYLASALDVPARLLPVPPAFLRLVAALIGKGGEAGRLLDSLEINDSLLRRELAWSPPYSVAEGLGITARWFRENIRQRII